MSYKLKKPKLASDAIPSQLPNCPSYMSQPTSTERSSRDSILLRKEELHIVKAMEASRKDFEEQQTRNNVSSITDLKQKLKIEAPWQMIMMDAKGTKGVSISYIKHLDSSGSHIDCSLHINNDMMLTAYMHSVELEHVGKNALPMHVNSLHQINEVCDTIMNMPAFKTDVSNDAIDLTLKLIVTLLLSLQRSLTKFAPVISFVIEQLQLTTKRSLVYSSEFLIFASIFQNLSPHGYRFLRNSGKIILPCLTTIRKVTLSSSVSPVNEQSEHNFMFYIKNKYKALQPRDKTVCLLVDEIHLAPFFDYKGGNLVGAAYDSTKAATSAFVFMITSVFSDYKDVVHVLPSCKMTAIDLFKFLCKSLKSLETIGFRVISVITDNNAINRKAMSNFSSPPQLLTAYPHPCDSSRPLFFILDTVHIFKCIRNNWLNQKTEGKCLVFPHFNFANVSTSVTSDSQCAYASLSSLKQLHHLEVDSTIKYAYKLSAKALSPSNLERQNVKLVIQIFNEFVSHALHQLGGKFGIPHWQNTAAFIDLIKTWWDIVNVCTPNKGDRLKNNYQKPIIGDNTESKEFLKQFLDWLLQWDKMVHTSGKLTKETFSALKHTTQALLEISHYCLQELGARYVLLGKFQTDSLEARFGQYRQLAGGKYDVSLRQVYECEKKLRLLSVLQLSLKGRDISIEDFSFDWDNFNTGSSSLHQQCPIAITAEDAEQGKNYLPAITYIAGYCCYSANKKLKCQTCKDLIASSDGDTQSIDSSMIKGLSRGGLIYPSYEIVSVVLVSYVVINKMLEMDEFHKSHSQRLLAMNTIISVVESENIYVLYDNRCANGHELSALIKMIVWACVNIILNNFCFKKNDEVAISRLAKRRKLSTLT